MDREPDWNLLGKYFSGECSPAEEKEIAENIAANPAFARLIQELSRILKMSGAGDQSSSKRSGDWNIDAAWRSVSDRAGVHRRSDTETRQDGEVARAIDRIPVRRANLRTLVLRYAAAVVLLIGAAAGGLYIHRISIQGVDNITMRKISAENGQRISLQFSDGTRVTLNGGSVLTLPDRFSGKRREVWLQGEAYFSVAHMNGIPFVVRLNRASAEVLGTEFAVSDWPGEDRVQLVVAEGRVAFRPGEDRQGKGVVVTHGQMATLSGGEITPPVAISLNKELAWLEGKLMFDQTPFGEVLRSLERRFGLSFSVGDSTILSRKLTATFQNETSNEVLKIISLSLNLDFRRSDNTVEFFRHNSKNR